VFYLSVALRLGWSANEVTSYVSVQKKERWSSFSPLSVEESVCASQSKGISLINKEHDLEKLSLTFPESVTFSLKGWWRIFLVLLFTSRNKGMMQGRACRDAYEGNKEKVVARRVPDFPVLKKRTRCEHNIAKG
jgi:hypothetical protein